jgi:hypothetical protein
MFGVLAEDLHWQVKGPRDHHQVGDLLEGSDLACGDLQAGRLDDDADDGRGAQTQEVRIYHTNDLEDSILSQPANPITDCALGNANLIGNRSERHTPVVLETGDNSSINHSHCFWFRMVAKGVECGIIESVQ